MDQTKNKIIALCGLLILPALTFAEDQSMVLIEGAFYIDVYEYPNQRGQLPKVDITWHQAETLCAVQGKRLCSEQEWQQACSGPENFVYSYADTFESGRCNTPRIANGIWLRGPGIAASGTYENCTNAFGVHDMIGNAWEWTSSWYSRPDLWRVVRGGSYFQNVNLARADARYGQFLGPEYHLDLVGFRCCRSLAK